LPRLLLELDFARFFGCSAEEATFEQWSMRLDECTKAIERITEVTDFNFAARVKGLGIQSTQFLLTPEPNVTYSACLVGKVEEMFVSGKAPYPVERTLLVSGILESCLTSRISGHQRLGTPHLRVKYQAPRESQHARA
jgi:hypothetical protein